VRTLSVLLSVRRQPQYPDRPDALTSHALGTANIDTATTALRAVVDHRDDLVKTRTQTVNRLHVVLTRLVPAGARRHLSADHAAELLRGVRPRDAAPKTLRALAMDLVSEVRQLDRRIAKAANDIQMAVSASGTTLTELHGSAPTRSSRASWPMRFPTICWPATRRPASSCPARRASATST
jgi:hypothetical protein